MTIMEPNSSHIITPRYMIRDGLLLVLLSFFLFVMAWVFIYLTGFGFIAETGIGIGVFSIGVFRIYKGYGYIRKGMGPDEMIPESNSFH